MRSARENPESEENQQATRDNERAVFAAQMEHKMNEQMTDEQELAVCRAQRRSVAGGSS